MFPNVIYAGTGETEIRLDVSYGDGVYKSTDAGGTWSHLGLRESRFVGRICIHPHDPDLVNVAALGDVFGANVQAKRYLMSLGAMPSDASGQTFTSWICPVRWS